MSWHRRMGHAPKQTLTLLAGASLVPLTTKEIDTLDTTLCKACLAGRFDRSSPGGAQSFY
jgi:hypothetical protein